MLLLSSLGFKSTSSGRATRELRSWPARSPAPPPRRRHRRHRSAQWPRTGMAALSAAERLALLARSWTEVASGYQEKFSGRFQPWMDDTLRLFAASSPPAAGTIAVPACGPGALHGSAGLAGVRLALLPTVVTNIVLPARSQPPAGCAGQELPLLAAAFPQHRIVGVDLSEGMVQLARQLVQRQGLAGRVEAVCADATDLSSLGPLAGVVSCFGLQQMPRPASVLASWTRALSPGGEGRGLPSTNRACLLHCALQMPPCLPPDPAPLPNRPQAACCAWRSGRSRWRRGGPGSGCRS